MPNTGASMATSKRRSKLTGGNPGTEKPVAPPVGSAMSEGILALTIPMVPVGPNGPKGTIRSHWATNLKRKKQWRDIIRLALCDVWNYLKPCENRVSVTVIQFRKKILDPDNAYTSLKFVLDSMKYWKLIKDDSDDWISLKIVQAKSKIEYTKIYVA